MRIFAFFSHSETGKTTLLEKLLQKLKEEGSRVGYLKLTRYIGPFDKEGKDTYRVSHKRAEKIGLLNVPTIQCIKDKTEKLEHEPLLLYTCSFGSENDLHIERF